MIRAFRLASWDTPFWVNPNRAPGRYHAAGSGPVQYWSLHPLTPWAEYLRSQGIRTPEGLRALRLRLWVATLDEEPLTLGFDESGAQGLAGSDLVADDQTPCRELGARCMETGAPRSLVVPSAALPGTRNVVLFGPRIAAPYDVRPVDDIDVPTAVAAEDAHALVDLLPLVRHLGEPHAELVAWERGETFPLPHPPTPVT